MEPILIREPWKPDRERRRCDRRKPEQAAPRPLPPIRPILDALPPDRPCGEFRIDPES